MDKIKIEKDNVVLSIEKEDLAQYKARGYDELGATKKVASKDLKKEVKKLTKEKEGLETKIANLEKENEELTAKIAELKK